MRAFYAAFSSPQMEVKLNNLFLLNIIFKIKISLAQSQRMIGRRQQHARILWQQHSQWKRTWEQHSQWKRTWEQHSQWKRICQHHSQWKRICQHHSQWKRTWEQHTLMIRQQQYPKMRAVTLPKRKSAKLPMTFSTIQVNLLNIFLIQINYFYLDLTSLGFGDFIIYNMLVGKVAMSGSGLAVLLTITGIIIG